MDASQAAENPSNLLISSTEEMKARSLLQAYDSDAQVGALSGQDQGVEPKKVSIQGSGSLHCRKWGSEVSAVAPLLMISSQYLKKSAQQPTDLMFTRVYLYIGICISACIIKMFGSFYY